MISSSEQETHQLGRLLAKKLQDGDIVALYGDLGAGKTTFAKGIVEELTGTPSRQITSPTFTYLNIYEGTLPLYHFDLYRLRHLDEFIEKGFSDFLEAPGICLIEWPDRIESLLQDNTWRVTLSHLEEGKREINVQENKIHSLRR